MFPHAYRVGVVEGIHGLGSRPVHLGHVHTGRSASARKLNRGLVPPILVAVHHRERDLATRRITRRRRIEQREGAQICEQVTQGKMPLGSYTLLHRQANLSDPDKKILCDWTETTRKSLAASPTTAPSR
jgi:hypothetical protein